MIIAVNPYDPFVETIPMIEAPYKIYFQS